MGIFDKFKKKEEKKSSEPKEIITPLEKLCYEENVSYNELKYVVLTDPSKYNEKAKDLLKTARKNKKENNVTEALMNYIQAAGLAIYEKDLHILEDCLVNIKKLDKEKKYTIPKDPKKTIEFIQKYYKKREEAEEKARKEKEIIKYASTNKK